MGRGALNRAKETRGQILMAKKHYKCRADDINCIKIAGETVIKLDVNEDWYIAGVEYEDLIPSEMIDSLTVEFKRDKKEHHPFEVEPVVRCKECTHADNKGVEAKGWRICTYNGQWVKDNDFCSYGVRNLWQEE